MEGAHPMLTLVLALAAGVVAQSVARHIHVPGIVLLLVAGAGLGPDGLAWIQPRSLGEGLFAIVSLAVAIILFEGGLNLDISRLRREQTPIRRLVTVGAFITLLGGTFAVRGLLGWAWMPALLFGSLVVVTGPTVIGPLVGELRLRPRVATVLEAEGVLIDPIGAILAVVILGLALSTDPGSLVLVDSSAGLARVAAGTVLGVAAGFLLASALRVSRLIPDGLQNVFVLSSVLLLYAGAELVLSQSGVLAVTIAGVVVGNSRSPVERDLREFKDQLTVMLIGLLFVTLAADVRYEQVEALGWAGFGVVATLVLVVRPFSVWLCTLSSELSRGERLFIAWVAPRGIVAAAIASLVAADLERAGMSGGAELRALVFLTIALTVTLAGLTAGPIGSLLGVRLRNRDTVAILGAQTLGLALGEELRCGDVPVVFLDSNPAGIRRAEEAGFTAVYGDALQESVMQRARCGFVQTVVALTANRTLNSVLVGRARERFGVPQGRVATSAVGVGLVSEQVDSGEARIVFDGPHDVDRWEVRGRRGDVEIEHFVHTPVESEEAESAVNPGGLSERFAMIAIRRGDEITTMHSGRTHIEGDVAAIALHLPEREDALRDLASQGWQLRPIDSADSGSAATDAEEVRSD